MKKDDGGVDGQEDTEILGSKQRKEHEETNVYVLELKKVFDNCTGPSKEGFLDQTGLSLLCDQLNLSQHTTYISGQLLPLPSSKINFAEFKRRFIQILPEIVDFSSATESPSRKKSKKSPPKNRSPLIDISDNLPTPIHSENDTSNDILSDFSDDDFIKQEENGVNVGKLQKKLRELGLCDNGFLGRYELRLLCQHVDELKHLRAEITENEIFDLTDTNQDGRISLEEFCAAYNRVYGSRRENVVSSPPDRLNDATYTKRTENPPDLIISQQRKGVVEKWRNLAKSQSEDFRDKREHLKKFRAALYKSDTGQSLRRKTVWRANLHNSLNHMSVSTSNILSSLSADNSGFVTFASVVEYFDSLGVESGREIMENIGFLEENQWINAAELSDALQKLLNQSALSPEAAVALLCYRAELEYLRISLIDTQGRAEHYKNELTSLQKRQNLLMEELDQSHASMETANKQKMSEIESKYQAELKNTEERQKSEKQELIAHLAEVEDLLHQKRQMEGTLKNRVSVLERESVRLKRDNQDLTQTISELEHLNEDLRKEVQTQTAVLSRKFSKQESFEKKQPDGTRSPDFLWRHKAEMAIAENKRLKDQIDELMENAAARKWNIGRYSPRGGRRGPRKQRRGSNVGGYVAAGNNSGTSALNFVSVDPVEKFQKEVLKHKRRKLKGPDEESSEFESDPDPVVSKPKYKKSLKKRDRLAGTEKREQRRKIQAAKMGQKIDRESTDSDKTGESSTPILGKSLSTLQLRTLQRQFSEERKQIAHQLKVEMAGTEDKWVVEKKDLLAQFEREKARIRNQSEQELQMIMDSRRKETQEALRRQELELETKFDALKREMEVRWTSERNAMERAFAEEKMVMITQLQEDFDMELRKIKSGKAAEVKDFVSPAGEHKRLEELKKEKQILEDSLDGQRHGFEAKMVSIGKEHEKKVAQLEGKLRDLEEWLTPEDLPEKLKTTFYRLEDEWREGQREKLNQERQDMLQGLKQEREQVIATAEQDKDFLVKQHSAQLADLEKKYQREIDELQRSLETATERPVTSAIEVQTAENLLEELEIREQRVFDLQEELTIQTSGFEAKEADWRRRIDEAQRLAAVRPETQEKMCQSESELGGRDPDSLIGNLRMELDLEKERCQDLEDEMKDLRGRLGVVQKDSQKRIKDAQDKIEEVLRKTEEKEAKDVRTAETETEQDFDAMLKTAVTAAERSEEKVEELREELRVSAESVYEKSQEIKSLEAKLRDLELEYSNRLNDAQVRLEEVTVEMETTTDRAETECQTEDSGPGLDELKQELETKDVELSFANVRIAQLEQEERFYDEEKQKMASDREKELVGELEKMEGAQVEIKRLRTELEKAREEKAILNDAQFQVTAALQERDRLEAELLEAQRREVIYHNQIDDAQMSLDKMNQDLKNSRSSDSDYKSQLTDTQIALKAVSEELQRRNEEYSVQEIDAQVKLRESQKECELLVDEVDRLKANEEDYENGMEELKNQLKNARKEAEELNSFLEEQKEQLRSILEEKMQMENELWEKIGQLNAENSGLQTKLNSMEGEEVIKKETQLNLMAERDSQLESYRAEVERVQEVSRIAEEQRTELEELKSIYEIQKEDLGELKKTDKEQKAELKNLRRMNQQQSAEFEELKRMEAEQEESLEKLRTANEKQHEEIENFIKAVEEEKAAFEVLRRTDEGNMAEIEKLRKTHEEQRIEVDELRQMTESQKTEQQKLDQEHSAELDKLRRIQEEQETQLEAYKKMDEGHKTELEKLYGEQNTELVRLRMVDEEQKAELEKFRRIDEQLKIELQELQKIEAEHKEEIENLTKVDGQQKDELERLRRMDGEYKKLLSDAQAGLVKAADEITLLKNREGKLKHRLQEKDDAKSQAEQERRAMEEEVGRLAAEAAVYSEQIGDAKEAVEGAMKELQLAKEQEEFYKNQVKELQGELDAAISARTYQQQKDILTESSEADSQKCKKCGLLEGRIAELEQAINMASESGIEDVGSSPDLYQEDPAVLTRENEKLKKRLSAAQEKLLELRTCLVLTGSQQVREECASRHFGQPSQAGALHRFREPFFLDFHEDSGMQREELREIERSLAGEVEKLREENFLLQARLDAKESLIQETVSQYRAQMKETASLGKLVQDLYKENGALIAKLGASLAGAERSAVIGEKDENGATDWSNARDALQDLYVELGRRGR